MTAIDRNSHVAEVHAVGASTKKGTTAAAQGLAIATLREAVDVLEDRLDDVDDRVAVLESETDVDPSGVWESLARGDVQQEEGVAAVPVMPPEPADPSAVISDVQELNPAVSLGEVKLSRPAPTTERENPQAPAAVRFLLTDAQFERLFGAGSTTTDSVQGDSPATVSQVTQATPTLGGSRPRKAAGEG